MMRVLYILQHDFAISSFKVLKKIVLKRFYWNKLQKKVHLKCDAPVRMDIVWPAVCLQNHSQAQTLEIETV